MLIVDANLLVLYTVGIADRKLISKHKRLQAYAEDDFDLLFDILSRSDGIILVPHVLAETSNLLGFGTNTIERQVIFEAFAWVMRRFSEEFVESAIGLEKPEFGRLGLTDAVLLVMADRGHELITVDLDLYLATLNAGKRAINYNHLRGEKLGL